MFAVLYRLHKVGYLFILKAVKLLIVARLQVIKIGYAPKPLFFNQYGGRFFGKSIYVHRLARSIVRQPRGYLRRTRKGIGAVKMHSPVLNVRTACRAFYGFFYFPLWLIVRHGSGYFRNNVIAAPYEHTRAYPYAFSYYIVKIIERSVAYCRARKFHRFKMRARRKLARAAHFPRYVL